MRRSNSSVQKLWDRGRAVLVTLLLVVMTIPLYSLPVIGQVTTGAVKGTVSDQSGAVVVGAKVVVKNQDTGVESATFNTSSTGDYRIPSLNPGKYRVTIEAASFKRSVTTDVDVRLGLESTINVTLQPGGVSEEITVTSAGENQVQTDTSQISGSFETRKVADLPTNSADGGLDNLALLAPGVVPGFGNVNSNGTTLSVNGNRARSNNFTIDGTDNNDLSIGGPSFFVDNQDAVQEFQVITSNFSAQYGRNQGAIVNYVTKSGTNQFHGSAFEYYRDSGALDALDNIQKAQGLDKPPFFLSNTFGGTAGGPIKRDKIFFFATYYGIRQPSTASLDSGNLAILPSEYTRLNTLFPNNATAVLTKQGAFALTGLGQVSGRTDRTLRATYPNVVSSSIPCQVTPAGSPAPAGAQDFINLIDSNGCANLFAGAFPHRNFSTPFTENEYSVRGDVNLNSRNTFNARYLYQKEVFTNNLGGTNGFTGDVPANSRNLSGTYNRVFSSRAVNEFRATYQKLDVLFGGGCSDPLKGCIPDPTQIGTAFTNIVYGVRGVLTNSALQTIGPATNLPQGRSVKVYQFTDNFNYTRGKHQMIMGIDIHRLTNEVPFLPNINGGFNFSSGSTLATNRPTQVVLAAGQPILNYKETDFFPYFQDDFKIRENLTLNLGVRYENTGQPINLLNTLTTDRESNSATAVWRQNIPLNLRTVPFVPTDGNNWAPRIGFAYSPRFEGDTMKRLFGSGSDTVIRGGYSIAYDASFYNILLNVSTATPTVFNNTITQAASTFSLPANPTGDVVRSSLGAFLQKNTFDPHFLNQTLVSGDFHSPYSQQWSIGVQRQINRNNVMEIRYVGNHGVGLFQSLNSNPFIGNLVNGFTATGADGVTRTFQGFPSLATGFTVQNCTNVAGTPDNEGACNGRILAGNGLVRTRSNTAMSSYNGLQMRYNGRIGNQLTLGASYTWSKAIDNASEIFSFGEGAFAANPLNVTRPERGLSGFDRRNAFSFNFIYDVPFFKDKTGVVGKLVTGWQLNSTYFLASGQPYTASQVSGFAFGLPSYQDNTFQATFVGLDAIRPFIGNPNAPRTAVGITNVDAAYYLGVTTPSSTGFYSYNELNTTGNLVSVSKNDVRYIVNGPGAAALFGNPFGNSPRNGERGPRLNLGNFGIFKNTKFKERYNVQFQANFYNVFNHPNSGTGVASGSSLLDNVIEDAGISFNDRTQVNLGYRRMQFGLKLIF